MEKVKPKNIAAGSLMGRRCLYAGSRDFLLTSSGVREVEAGKTGWAPIMIIGREYYFETVKDFPMSSAGEVRATACCCSGSTAGEKAAACCCRPPWPTATISAAASAPVRMQR